MTVFEVPHNLSHSQTNNLVGDYCGAQYWYERVLGKPSRPGWAAIGGSALHSASEEWDWAAVRDGEVDDSPERLSQLFNAAFDKEIAEKEEDSPFPREEWNVSGRAIKSRVTMDGGPNKKDEAWWREMGPEMLRTYTAWRLTSPWEIAEIPDKSYGLADNDDSFGLPESTAGIEVPFEVEIAGIPVRGYVDRVFEKTIDGVLEYLVVDLKSGRLPDDTAQLGTYRVGLLRQYGIDPRWGAYWLGGTGSCTPFTELRTLWPPARVEQRFGKARRIQLAGDFTHKPSNLCGSCGVREYCPIANGAKASEVTQPWDSGVEIRVKDPRPEQ